MGAKTEKAGKRRPWKWIKRGLALVLGAAVLAGGAYLLYPLAVGTAQTQYASYTAQTGDIVTTMSFSAQISVASTETLQNASTATVSKIYVTEDQAVEVGEPIIALSNGETLKSSIHGTVNEISVAEGDFLWRSRSLVQIADFSRMEVALSVDEYDVHKVQAGQPCTVSIISLGLDLETKISHINLVSASTGNVARYAATAELDAPENVLPGMAATVTLPAEERLGVTTLEVAALSFDEEGSAYVLRRQPDGSYTQQPVETGLSDGMRVEILSGLEPGEEVWVITGTEEAETFSLAKLYASLVGQTVVIQEGERARGNQGRTSWQGETGSELPEGMTLPEGVTLPEGMEHPAGMERPGVSEEADVPVTAEEETAPEATETAENGAQGQERAFPADGERPDREGAAGGRGMRPGAEATTEQTAQPEAEEGIAE